MTAKGFVNSDDDNDRQNDFLPDLSRIWGIVMLCNNSSDDDDDSIVITIITTQGTICAKELSEKVVSIEQWLWSVGTYVLFVLLLHRCLLWKNKTFCCFNFNYDNDIANIVKTVLSNNNNIIYGYIFH